MLAVRLAEMRFGETGHLPEVSSMPISFRFLQAIARIAAMVGALFGVESPQPQPIRRDRRR